MKNDLIEGLPSVSWEEGFYSFGVQTKNSDKPLQCRNQSVLSDLLLIEPIRFSLSAESIKTDLSNCQNCQKKAAFHFHSTRFSQK